MHLKDDYLAIKPKEVLIEKAYEEEKIDQDDVELETQPSNNSELVKSKIQNNDMRNIVVFSIGLLGLIIFYNYYTSNSHSSKVAVTTSDSRYQAQTNVGETLHANIFEITVNKVDVTDYVDVGTEFLNLKRETGTDYLIMNVTFKNIDTESRMIVDGELLINFNGKDYKFDKSEVIAANGWGLLLDEINPLTSKTTNLVYKIPSDLKGKIYWHPGRTDENETIYLGEI